MRRRRQARIAVGVGLGAVVALVVAVLTVLALTKDDGSDDRVSARSDRIASVETTASTSPQSTTEAPTTTTEPPVVGGVVLKKADPKKPVEKPFQIYKEPKVTLLGSVPSVKVAQGYYYRATQVLGAANVIVKMKLDPRAPEGPSRVITDSQFDFEIGQAIIGPQFESLLNTAVYTLNKLPEITLVITGYTDNVGSAEANQKLSEERAQAIVNYLVAKGVPANRVVARGAGEADPIADNNTAEGRKLNRRIEGTDEGLMPFAPMGK